MKKASALLVAFAIPLAMASVANAQPINKLTALLNAEQYEAAWCSGIFYEESYWYDDDPDRLAYYEDLAFEAETVAYDGMEALGFRTVEIDEVWDVMDEWAYELVDSDEDGFLAKLDECLEVFGSLVQEPKSD